MDLIGCANRLGVELDRRYSRVHYNTREFHRIAMDVLASHKGDLRVPPADVVAAAMSPDLPWQSDVESLFGEPAITLYFHPRFRIDALCWRNGATSIHQHQFAGAFMVLCGSSVQTRYRFTTSIAVSETFLVGDLRYEGSLTLSTGDLEPIELGDRLIHSVFHLDHPTITLVVRTHSHPAGGVQFRYEPPCVAYDPFANDYQTAKRLQIVEYLCDVQPAGWETSIADLLRQATMPLAFAVLRQMRISRVDRVVWARLFDAAVAAHGPLMATFCDVFEHVDRQRTLMTLRRSTTDPALRYFMALLLSVPRGRDIRRAVADRVGEERAVGQIVEWVAAIKARPGSRDPLTDTDCKVLAAMLSTDDMSAPPPSAGNEAADWVRSREQLRRSVLLRPLLGTGCDAQALAAIN